MTALATDARRSKARESVSPPFVLRGADLQVGLDWLRMSAPKDLAGEARKFMAEMFGSTTRPGRGKLFFATCTEYESGALLLEDHNSHDLICLDFSGSVLAEMTPDDRVALMTDLLAMGFKATRIDVALDLIGFGESFIDRALDSCERGSLCGLRSFTFNQDTRSNLTVTGRVLRLGKRAGCGGGTYVRFYDKGLETKTREMGEWERWETEFTGKKAAILAEKLAESGTRWAQTATVFALGACDFRIRDGVNLAIARRDREPWWEELVGQAERAVISIMREPSSLAKTQHWLTTQVGPLLAEMGRRAGLDTVAVFGDLLGPVQPSRNARFSKSVHEYEEYRRRLAGSPGGVGHDRFN